jgi:cytochrome b subunit of formate dehydrogenase
MKPERPPRLELPARSARLVSAVLLLSGLAAGTFAQENEDCLECHSVEGLSMLRDGRTIDLFVDADRFDESVHAGMDCTMCHFELMDVEEYPHARDLERVDCTGCHDDDDGPVNDWRESTHGRLAEEGDPLAPLCQDCHGEHYVAPLDSPDSSISPFRIPFMCAQCHAEGAEVERVHDVPQEQVFERYQDSIHGEGLFKQGLIVTAVCTSCHTGHNVLPHTDPRSTIHKDNVPGTCMQCHGQIEQVHRKVIAGELWEVQGAVPLCVECHSPHEVREVFYDTNMSDADCLKCHSDSTLVAADGREMFVDRRVHDASVHGRDSVSCAQCHSDASPSVERSCSTIQGRVNCSTCHEAEVVDFERGVHGSLHAAGDPSAPYCTDCHGDHGILEHQIPEGASDELTSRIRTSPIYSRNVPELCGQCHREGGQAARRIVDGEHEIVINYSMSIHGRGLMESGLTVTAVCTDCHTAHKELPPDDPESSVSDDGMAATCGQCHDGIYEKYETSVHSEIGNPDYEQLRDMPELPHCNDCHSSHGMARTDRPEFQLGIMEQCGTCHEEITETYFATYHGKASALGDTTRAKCYDCHGAHDVHSSSDLRSLLHEANIVETCAKCHEGSHTAFTGYLTHANHHDRERYPALFYAFWGMTLLLVGVFVFFGLHTLVWLPRSWKLHREHKQALAAIPPSQKQYMRFRKKTRILHFVVIVSFFGLAVTGMILKFSDAGWARLLSNLVGGIAGAGIIHRLCAVATFGYMGYHLVDVYLRYKRSKKRPLEFLFGPDSILPRPKDVRDFVATIKWFVGKGPQPNYGRWTYWEKFDYFAVFWGVMIIGASGLLLWFPVFFTRLLPGWTLNVATIIHSDEALLAVGFIFTIHFFNTHLRPEKFPMDPVIFTGRMHLEELKLERPAHYARLEQSGELQARLVDPAPPYQAKLARAFAYCAVAIGVTLIVLIVKSLLEYVG